MTRTAKISGGGVWRAPQNAPGCYESWASIEASVPPNCAPRAIFVFIGNSLGRRFFGFAMLLAAMITAARVEAFPLVVQPGDTLAGVAQRIYGRVELEGLLVMANGLEVHGGIAIVPGMRLEVPSLAHRRVRRGDTWPSLAMSLLGGAERAAVLAFSNSAKPWSAPAENAEILVPYNLRYIATGGETLSDIADRFLGSRKRVWMLASYNGLQDAPLGAGSIVLVPLTDLRLTPVGQDAARRALEGYVDVAGDRRTEQLAAAEEVPQLLAEVRGGRYAEAVARGMELLMRAPLTTPQRASVQRGLLEAYVALGATGRASDACREWRKAAPRAQLDPVDLSPKVLAACGAR